MINDSFPLSFIKKHIDTLINCQKEETNLFESENNKYGQE